MNVARIACFAAAAMLTTPAFAAPVAKPAGFAICGVCHKVEKGAPNGIGPNLFGVGGTKAGEVPGFNFSPAMKQSGIVWTKPKLVAFITAPQKVVPGTKMMFAGMKDPKVANAIATYVLSLK
jgi:cytochrome c